MVLFWMCLLTGLCLLLATLEVLLLGSVALFLFP